MDSLSGYKKETRPWGAFEQFTRNEQTTVKILTVLEGEEFSLQTHEHRDEFWRVLSGTGTITVGSSVHEAVAGGEFFVQRGTAHRAMGGIGGIEILEISFGTFDEDDITRLEDKYGRA